MRAHHHSERDSWREIWIGALTLFAITVLGLGWLFVSLERQSRDVATIPVIPTTVASSTTTSTAPVLPGPQTKDRPSDTVLTLAQHLSGASRFAELLSTPGIATQLKGPGPYTIFVPTNAAFGLLPPGTITKLSKSALLRLVEYHVVVGRAVDGTAQVSGTMQALSRDALNFSFGPDHVPMVNSAIMVIKYNAKNGVVYLIDSVLIPPISIPQSI